MTMEIGHILQRLDATKDAANNSIKTASAAPAQNNADDLRGALRNALTSGETTKTASVSNTSTPQGDLIKMASDLTDAEDAATMKQASIYGAAMCDGFMSRFGQYEKEAEQIVPTTFAKSAGEYDTFEKFASDNPDLVKEAYAVGYRQTYDGLVKQANDEFTQGYNDTIKQANADYEQGFNDQLVETHKVAAHMYKRGAYAINDIIQRTQAQ